MDADNPDLHLRLQTNNQEKLCVRCDELNLDQLLQGAGGRSIVPLGTLVQQRTSPECPFCRFLHQVASFNRSGEISSSHDLPHSICVISSLDIFCDKFSEQKRYSEFPTLRDTVLLGVIPTKTIRRSARVGVKRAKLVDRGGFFGVANQKNLIGTNRNTFDLRHLAPTRINWLIIKRWIRVCKDQHTEQCSKTSEKSVIRIVLIDCHTRKLVPANTDIEYVALSYVWGKPMLPRIENLLDAPHEENMELPPGKLPNTIEDAISVTKLIGHQFLWVDRYCIPQRDSSEKHTQIAQMDIVYANAEVTIVAAGGKDSEYGLPGVHSRPRLQQPSTKVLQHNLVATLPSASEAVKSSFWFKRAWTYQEAIFSRRLLIFTDHQIYFECRSMHCCEAIAKPLAIIHTKDMQRLREVGGDGRLFQWRGKLHQWDIASRIADFSERDLTYSSDALNAILGIFRSFEELSIPLRHFWGVPIITDELLTEKAGWSLVRRDYQSCFATGLCWAHVSPAKRRPSFPSWSWAGWIGRVDENCTELYQSRTFDALDDEEQLDIRIESRDGQMVDWSHYMESPLSSISYSLYKPILHLQVNIVSLRFEFIEKRPPWFGWLAHKARKPKLGFWAIFDASRDMFDSDSDSSTDAKKPEIWSKAYAPLRLSKDAPVNSDFFHKLQQETWEGVVISNTLFSNPSPTRWDEQKSRFLMVIEPIQGNIAERIGTVDLADTCVPEFWHRDFSNPTVRQQKRELCIQ